jgi:hypothetical protein
LVPITQRKTTKLYNTHFGGYFFTQPSFEVFMLHIYDANNHIRRAFERGDTVTDMVNPNPAEVCIWVFDGVGAKKPRLALYPEYKAKRNVQSAIDSGFFDFLRAIETDLLKHCKNTFVMKQPCMEADDVIAALVEQYRASQQILIHSNDADFQALVDENVSVSDRSKKLSHVEPHDIRLYKTLVGDASDNLGGIEGFGDGKWQVLTEEDKAGWRNFLKEEIPEWMGDNLYPLNGLTKKPLEWMKVTENQQLLRTYWQIVGFLPVNMQELSDKYTSVGVYNPVKFQETLDKFMWS